MNERLVALFLFLLLVVLVAFFLFLLLITLIIFSKPVVAVWI